MDALKSDEILLHAAIELKKRRLAQEHLLSFAEYTHPSWITGPHHKIICEHLERVERGEIRRLMISAPPRHGKSELASKRFPAWCLGRHPEWQVICCSHTAQLAMDFSADVRNLVRDRYYRNIFPKTEIDPKAAASDRWRTTLGGIYVAAGVDGAITGRGAHIAIIDDPIKGRNEAESMRMREVAWRWYIGDLYQRLMPNGAIVFMMTRWHEDDLAARALRSDDWTVLELQAIKNEHTDHEEALWPDRFPLSSLCEKRDVMVGSGRKRDWESQYQQNPKPYSGVYCKPEYYEERWIDESLPSEMNIYMASDFAVSEVEENSDPDWTEHGVFGVGPDEKTYVLDWWSGQATADVWIDGLLDLASKWKPLLWVGEGGVIRRSIEPFLTKRMRERGIFLNSEWRQSTQRKEVRARSFQARSAMKLIVFPRHCVWSERVIDQCIAFPGGKHDDAFDVLSLFCSAIDETNSPVLKPVSEYNKNDRWKPITAKFYGNENKWKTI